MKFKKGDIVKGTKASTFRYGITTEYMTKAEVISTDGGYMEIRVLQHSIPSKVGDVFVVDADEKYFELVKVIPAKKGDIVKILNTLGARDAGAITTVISVRDCGHLELAIDRDIHFDTTEVEVISEEKISKKDTKIEKKEVSYKVGDKVRVKDGLAIDGKYGKCYFVGAMKKYSGQIATITDINNSYYMLDIDNGSWNWTEEMFSPVNEESRFAPKIKDSGMVTYVYIGDITIAVPRGIPVGITKKHSDDEYSTQIGEAVSLKRMMDNAHKLGMIEI